MANGLLLVIEIRPIVRVMPPVVVAFKKAPNLDATRYHSLLRQRAI